MFSRNLKQVIVSVTVSCQDQRGCFSYQNDLQANHVAGQGYIVVRGRKIPE